MTAATVANQLMAADGERRVLGVDVLQAGRDHRAPADQIQAARPPRSAPRCSRLVEVPANGATVFQAAARRVA